MNGGICPLTIPLLAQHQPLVDDSILRENVIIGTLMGNIIYYLSREWYETDYSASIFRHYTHYCSIKHCVDPMSWYLAPRQWAQLLEGRPAAQRPILEQELRRRRKGFLWVVSWFGLAGWHCWLDRLVDASVRATNPFPVVGGDCVKGLGHSTTSQFHLWQSRCCHGFGFFVAVPKNIGAW